MNQQHLKKTLETIFFCRQFDTEFIEAGNELGLSEYFQELDLENCDLQLAYDNVWLVCKHANIGIFLSLLSILPVKFSEALG